MIEVIIKIAGSVLGPAIGRLARGRPQAEVIAKPIVGTRPYEYIHIQNPGPGSVLIRGVQARPPGIYCIARDHSPGAITRAQVNIDAKVLLRPGETCDLPLISLRDPHQSPGRRTTVASSLHDLLAQDQQPAATDPSQGYELDAGHQRHRRSRGI